MEPKELRRRASRVAQAYLDQRKWFAREGDPPRTIRLALEAVSLGDGPLLEVTFEFECSKEVYESARDPEVAAMIREVMDAVHVKAPELKAASTRIAVFRTGEHPIYDIAAPSDDDLDMPPADDAD